MSADRSKPAGAVCGHCDRPLWDGSDHARDCPMVETEVQKLSRRYEAIRAQGGDMAFTLGDDPGSMEEVAAVANAMLDYEPTSEAGVE